MSCLKTMVYNYSTVDNNLIIMFMLILCLHISMYLYSIIAVASACSALITIDNVNTVCSCVYTL